MKNIGLSEFILLGALSYCIMRFINTYDVKKLLKKLFTKHDENRLPVDYDCVHSQLDAQVKRLARKHDVNLKFKIHERLINSNLNECQVSFFGENYSHEFSFSFFKNIKHPCKKTPASAIQRVVFNISSDLEDKLVNFLILDKLRSLDRKPTESL